MKVSLFVTTYEMPRHLELVCAGLQRQSCQDFEVLFCDDGSSEETAEIIRNFHKSSGIPYHHIWQENRGYRRSRILNRALEKAQGEFCVFTDGDCVPHRDFVLDHLSFQQEGYYLAGRRLEVGEQLSRKLTPAHISRGFFDWPHPQMVMSALRGDSSHLNRSIRITHPGLRKVLKLNRVTDLKGCNFSVSRKVMESIGGYDEAYEGYGREDTDVEIRLQNLGLKIRSLKGVALQFHIWHPRREFTPANEALLDDVKKSGRTLALQGIRRMETLL